MRVPVLCGIEITPRDLKLRPPVVNRHPIMDHGRWPQGLKSSILVVLFSMFVLCGGRELRPTTFENYDNVYNKTLAKILVEYASAVYIDDLDALLSWSCSRCNGLTKGFEMIELIVDVQHCLQAFVGVAEDLKAIVIAFRGTQENSLQNWVENLFCMQLDLNYPGMPGAMVHHGFYSAYHNTTLRPRVLEAVQRTQLKENGLSIMITGHSMGGAMAAFCALDLMVNYRATDVQVVTFGQPRVGNSVFASYYNAFVPKTIRVTHEHDIVPHLPPYYTYFPKRTYHHFPREVWIYYVELDSLVYEVEKVCDKSGEDPLCSRSVSGYSISDHLQYYGVNLQGESWGSCGFIWQDAEMGKIDGKVDHEVISLVDEKPFSFLPEEQIDSGQHSSL